MMKFVAIIVTGLVLPVSTFAQMHDHPAAQATVKIFRVGDIVVDGPWLRATPAGAKVGGGYMKITNNGTTPDRLIGGSIELAGRFEIHEMAVVDGIMRMRPLDDGLEIRPGETVELQPGGFHVMAMNLSGRYQDNTTAKGSLQFLKAGTLAVEYVVKPLGQGSGH